MSRQSAETVQSTLGHSLVTDLMNGKSIVETVDLFYSQEGATRPGMKWDEELVNLGNTGWEMVSIFPQEDDGTTFTIAYFKRPLEEEPRQVRVGK